jgi:hypothetical protein
VPSSSPSPLDDEDAEGEDEDMDEDDYDEEEEDYDSEEEEQLSAQRRAKTQNRFSQSVMSRTSADGLEPGPTLVRAGAKQTNFDLLAVAKGLTPNISRITLQESDHVIVETERLVEKVHESLQADTPDKRTEVLGQVAQELVALWHSAAKSKGSQSAPFSPPSSTNCTTPADVGPVADSIAARFETL